MSHNKPCYILALFVLLYMPSTTGANSLSQSQYINYQSQSTQANHPRLTNKISSPIQRHLSKQNNKRRRRGGRLREFNVVRITYKRCVFDK